MGLTVKQVLEKNSIEENIVIGVFGHLQYRELIRWLYLLRYKWTSGKEMYDYTPSELNTILSNKKGIGIIGILPEK